jgi:hypothetical protein
LITYCSDVARHQGVLLPGTAAQARAWILIEHPDPWGRRAVEEADLPPALRRWLSRQLQAFPGARAVLVRQEIEPTSRPLALFVAISEPAHQRLYRLPLAAVEEREPQLASLLAAPEGWADHLQASSVLLICTNARRDRCCGRRGLPTYRALQPLLGEAAWQSSHLGGHRYAATALWLPEGVAYGFLEPADAPKLAAACKGLQIHLDRFRGRTFHPPPAQAADSHVRQELGLLGVDDVRLLGIENVAAGRWEVRLAAVGEPRRFGVRAEAEPEALVSCSPAARRREVASYSVEQRV